MGGLLIYVLLAVAGWFAFTALRPAEVSYGGFHGTLTYEGLCKFVGRGYETADCSGTFRSDDGLLQVHDVAFSVHRRMDWLNYDEVIPVRITNPAAREAMPDEGANTDRAVRGVIAVVLVAWAIAQSVWWVRHYRRTRR
jgi:hypothetical protein